MKEQRPHDWFVATMNNPNSTFSDFEEAGVTPDSSKILSKDVYKNSDKVKEKFKNEKGEFDEDAFNTFYEYANATYNKFDEKLFNNRFINSGANLFESIYDSDNPFEKTLTRKPTIDIYSRDFTEKTRGMSYMGGVGKEKKSAREAAQKNFVRDSDGNILDWTPQDDDKSGIIDSLKNPTLYLAKDEKTGRLLLDDNGQPYYKVLKKGEDAIGKEVLSVFDTLSDEDSWINRYDFFDSDGIDKSTIGVLAKAAASTIPYLIPYVGQAYGLLTAGMVMGEVLPKFVNAFQSLWLGDEARNNNLYKGMNSVSSYFTRFNQSVSDEGRKSMFNSENLIGMVPMIFGQLQQQKGLASIPSMLGNSRAQSAAVKAAIKENPLAEKFFKEAVRQGKGSEAYRQLIAISPKAAEAFNSVTKTYNNVGKYMSSTYMAMSQASEMYNASKEAGIGDRDGALLTLALTGAYSLMFNKLSIGDWAIKGVGLDDASIITKKAVRSEADKVLGTLKTSLDELKKTASSSNPASREAANKAIFKRITNAGKVIAERAYKASDALIKNLDSKGIQQYLSAAALEGIEEVTEEAAMDVSKGIYNLFAHYGIATHEEKRFKFSLKESLDRYLLSLTAGAGGGVMFKGYENFLNRNNGAGDPDQNKDMIHLIKEGHRDLLVKKVEQFRKSGEFGSKNRGLNTVDGNAELFTQEDNPELSQNDIVCDMLIANIDYIDNLLHYENIPTEQNIYDTYNAKVGQIVDMGLNTSMLDDLEESTNKIVVLKGELNKLNNEKAELEAGADSSMLDDKIKETKDELKEQRKFITELKEGVYIDKYFQEAMFSISDGLKSAFGAKSRTDWIRQEFGKNYTDLSEEDKVKADEKYKEYVNTNKRYDTVNAYQNFDEYRTTHVDGKIESILEKVRNERSYYEQENVPATLFAINQTEDPTSISQLDPVVFRPDIENEINNNIRYDIINNEVDRLEHIPKEIGEHLLNKALSKIGLASLDGTPESVDKAIFDAFLNANGEAISYHYPTGGPGDKTEFFDAIQDVLNGSSVEEALAANNMSIDDYKRRTNPLVTPYGTEEYIEYPWFDPNKLEENYNKSVELLKDISKALELKAKIDSKVIENPINDILSSALFEDDEAVGILGVVKEEYDKIRRSGNLDDYVLNNNISIEAFERFDENLKRLSYVLGTYVTFDSDLGQRGYNDAINKMRVKNPELALPQMEIMNQSEYVSLIASIADLSSKIDYLKRLSVNNSSNQIKIHEELGIRGKAVQYKYLYGLIEELNDFEFNGEEFVTEGMIDFISSFPEGDELISMLDSDTISISNYGRDKFNAFEEKVIELEHMLFERVNELANNDSEKTALLDKLISGIGTDYSITDDHSFDTESKVMDDFTKRLYLEGTLLVSSKEVAKSFSNKDFLQESKYAPFFVQEFNAKTLYVYTKNKFNRNRLKGLQDKLSFPSGMPVNKNIIELSGKAGSGKTSAVAAMFFNAIDMIDKKVAVFAPFEEQGNVLSNSLSNNENIVNKESGKSKEILFSKIMPIETYRSIVSDLEKAATNDKGVKSDYFKIKKDPTTKAQYIVPKEDNDNIKHIFDDSDYSFSGFDGIDIIFFDEATYLSSVEKSILNAAVEKYNNINNTNLTIVFAGDYQQTGYAAKFSGDKILANYSSNIKLPRLEYSLRNGFNLKVDNQIKLSSLSDIIKEKLNKKEDLSGIDDLIFAYKSNEDLGLVGDKIVDRFDVSLFDEVKGQTVFITDNITSDNVLAIKESGRKFDFIENRSTADPDAIIIADITKVQGSEFDNAIIDIAFDKTTKGYYKGNRQMELLLTSVTRSKKASIIIMNDDRLNEMTFKTRSKNTKQDIINSALDPNSISSYKDSRMNVYSKFFDYNIDGLEPIESADEDEEKLTLEEKKSETTDISSPESVLPPDSDGDTIIKHVESTIKETPPPVEEDYFIDSSASDDLLDEDVSEDVKTEPSETVVEPKRKDTSVDDIPEKDPPVIIDNAIDELLDNNLTPESFIDGAFLNMDDNIDDVKKIDKSVNTLAYSFLTPFGFDAKSTVVDGELEITDVADSIDENNTSEVAGIINLTGNNDTYNTFSVSDKKNLILDSVDKLRIFKTIMSTSSATSANDIIKTLRDNENTSNIAIRIIPESLDFKFRSSYYNESLHKHHNIAYDKKQALQDGDIINTVDIVFKGSDGKDYSFTYLTLPKKSGNAPKAVKDQLITMESRLKNSKEKEIYFDMLGNSFDEKRKMLNAYSTRPRLVLSENKISFNDMKYNNPHISFSDVYIVRKGDPLFDGPKVSKTNAEKGKLFNPNGMTVTFGSFDSALTDNTPEKNKYRKSEYRDYYVLMKGENEDIKKAINEVRSTVTDSAEMERQIAEIKANREYPPKVFMLGLDTAGATLKEHLDNFANASDNTETKEGAKRNPLSEYNTKGKDFVRVIHNRLGVRIVNAILKVNNEMNNSFKAAKIKKIAEANNIDFKVFQATITELLNVVGKNINLNLNDLGSDEVETLQQLIDNMESASNVDTNNGKIMWEIKNALYGYINFDTKEKTPSLFDYVKIGMSRLRSYNGLKSDGNVNQNENVARNGFLNTIWEASMKEDYPGGIFINAFIRKKKSSSSDEWASLAGNNPDDFITKIREINPPASFVNINNAIDLNKVSNSPVYEPEVVEEPKKSEPEEVVSDKPVSYGDIFNAATGPLIDFIASASDSDLYSEGVINHMRNMLGYIVGENTDITSLVYGDISADPLNETILSRFNELLLEAYNNYKDEFCK